MTFRFLALEGDGIEPEIKGATLAVFKATGDLGGDLGTRVFTEYLTDRQGRRE